MSEAIVFFLPETGVYEYARMLATYADALQRNGIPVIFLACDGNIKGCVYEDAINSKKIANQNVSERLPCAECYRKINIVKKRYGITIHYFSEFISDYEKKEIESIVPFSAEKLINFYYDDINIGNQCKYNFILTYKNDKMYFSESKTISLRNKIVTSIIIRKIIQKILNQVKPKTFVCSQNYYTQASLRNICLEKNIPLYDIETTLFMGYSGAMQYIHNDLAEISSWKHLMHWNSVKTLTVQPERVRDIFDDVYFRNFGKNGHLFSPNKGNTASIYEKLSLDKHKKILVAYPSSEDETPAAKLYYSSFSGKDLKIYEIFDSQIEWLQFLIEFTEEHNFQLVIRMHPRMGKVRSNFASPALLEYEKTFVQLPKNCCIVWPDEPLSSYDIAELADIVLTRGSSMGPELSKIGVPIVAATRTSQYTDSTFIRCPDSREEYVKAMLNTLEIPYSFQILRDAIRFAHFMLFMQTYTIQHGVSEAFPPRLEQDIPIPRASDTDALIMKDIIMGKITPFDINIKNLLHCQKNNDAEEKEKLAIFKGICHLFESTYTLSLTTQDGSRAPVSRMTFFKTQLKKTLPRWALTPLKWCWDIKQTYFPDTFVRKIVVPFHEKNVLKITANPSCYDVCIEKTAQDSTLRILYIADVETTIYFRHGVAISRTSRLFVRLAHLVLDNFSESNFE